MEAQKKYDLLSEINAYTEKVFIPRRKDFIKQGRLKTIADYIIPETRVENNYLDNKGYYQDPAIILNSVEGKQDVSLINDMGWKIGEVIIWNRPEENKTECNNIENGNTYTGGEPKTFREFKEKRAWIHNELEKYKKKHATVIQPKEYMLSITNAIPVRVKTDKENDKGGNYISAPNHDIIFYIDHEELKMPDVLTSYTTALLCPLECSFKNKGTFRHIDELMCFMPIGKDTFEIWIYDIEAKDETTRLYKKEQEENKKKINKVLKKKGYNKFKFREFKITFDKDNLFTDPPLFNRLFIETPKNILILFPSNKTTNNDDFSEVLKHIKSYSGEEDKPVTTVMINTLYFHNDGKNMGRAGGNLHCLIKQLLTPIK